MLQKRLANKYAICYNVSIVTEASCLQTILLEYHMTKLQVVQRFVKEIANKSFLFSQKNAVVTYVNDKFYFDDVEANAEMQAFYNQLTDAKIDETIEFFKLK